MEKNSEFLPMSEETIRGRYNDPLSYVHVGCEFYRVVKKPDIMGNVVRTLVPWKRAQLKSDFLSNPKDLDLIPRYDGMVNNPDYLAHEMSEYDFLNTFNPLSYRVEKGECTTIIAFLQHIFGEQIELALDYLQLLLTLPKQLLPILVLVSKERSTGKTTLLNLMKAIHGDNMIFLNNDAMRGRFNADWAGKLIIAVDETLLNRKEDTERLKAISTARRVSIEYKGRDRFEIDNYSKIILCSNNIDDPLFIDRQETRFWVREVHSLPTKEDPNLLEKMKQEIPAFQHYLINRKMHCKQKTRMWFSPDEIRTKALDRIIEHSMPNGEVELAERLLDLMDQLHVNKLSFTIKELRLFIEAEGIPVKKELHNVLTKSWNLVSFGSKHAYDYYNPSSECFERHYGRHYTFERAFLKTICPEVADVEDVSTAEDLPSDIQSNGGDGDYYENIYNL